MRNNEDDLKINFWLLSNRFSSSDIIMDIQNNVNTSYCKVAKELSVEVGKIIFLKKVFKRLR
jgi:hypothetical protein